MTADPQWVDDFDRLICTDDRCGGVDPYEVRAALLALHALGYHPAPNPPPLDLCRDPSAVDAVARARLAALLSADTARPVVFLNIAADLAENQPTGRHTVTFTLDPAPRST